MLVYSILSINSGVSLTLGSPFLILSCSSLIFWATSGLSATIWNSQQQRDEEASWEANKKVNTASEISLLLNNLTLVLESEFSLTMSPRDSYMERIHASMTQLGFLPFKMASLDSCAQASKIFIDLSAMTLPYQVLVKGMMMGKLTNSRAAVTL